MAKRIGTISIGLNLGTAQFIADADAANAKIRAFGSSTKTSMVASSAALRELEGNFANNTRAITRFLASTLGLGPELQNIFPIVGGLAFGTMIVELGEKVVNFFKSVREAPEAIAAAFREIESPLRLSNAELQVANDRLDNEIAKLEGRRQNTLKLALDEAAASALKLADNINKGLSALDKVVKEQRVGFFRQLLGEVGTDDVEKVVQTLERSIGHVTDDFGARIQKAADAKNKQLVTDLVKEERERIKNLYDAAEQELGAKAGKIQEDLKKFWGIPDPKNFQARADLITDALTDIQNQRKRQDLEIQNQDKTQTKEGLEAKNANAELTRPFDDRMAALNAKLQEAQLKLASVGKSEAFQSQAKAAGEALTIIAEVNKILEKQHAALTTAQQDQIKNIVLDTERTVSQTALDQKMDESIKKIRDQVQTQELLTAAIGKGYEATKKAAVETQVMTTLGAERYNDETLAAQRALLRVALAHEYDLKHTDEITKQVDVLSNQIELERSLAEVQMQGAEAVRLVTLAYKLRELVHNGAMPEMIKKEIDLANATRKTSEATDLAKIEQRIEALRRLSAAQVQGAEAARKAELESKRQEAIFSGKTVAEADKEVQEAELKHEQEIAQRALDRGLIYKNQLETLKQEEEELDKAAKISGETKEIELARRSIQKERLQLLVQETLEGRKAMDGVKAFFIEMQQQAKSAAQIIYDTLNSAVDRLSDEFAKFATHQKTNFREMFRSLAESALRESFKSAFQTTLGNIGKSIGGPVGGVLQKISGVNKRDGSDRAKALWVELAGSAGKAGSADKPDGTQAKPFHVIVDSLAAGSVPTSGGGGSSSISSTLGLFAVLASINRGLIPHASGGSVSPASAYLVGENGPEILIGASGRIASNSESQKLMGGDTHFHDYYVDARGAGLGVGTQVRRAIEVAHRSAVSTSVRASSDQRRRVVAKR